MNNGVVLYQCDNCKVFHLRKNEVCSRSPLLETALGHRVRYIARVSEFGTRRHWSGLQQATITLRDICFAVNHASVLPVQTFDKGEWCRDLYAGINISFEARMDWFERRDGATVEKVYRPTKVLILGAE
jgi:hypothetical protein